MEATVKNLSRLQEKTFEKFLEKFLEKEERGLLEKLSKEEFQKEWLIKATMFIDMFHSDSL